MTRTKKIGVILLAVVIIIQFIRPAKNNAAELITENDISKTYAISVDAHSVLTKKCYDCHSNKTHYPWYNNIQPVAWFLDYHIKDGKRHLNFSEFKTYPAKKANHKLEELSDAVNEGWMPLESYVWLHKETALTSADRDTINAWIKTLNVVFEKNAD